MRGCANAQALEARKGAKLKRCYYDLEDMLQTNPSGNVPYTPSIPLLYGLRESLRLLKAEGMENVVKRHHRCPAACAHMLMLLRTRAESDRGRCRRPTLSLWPWTVMLQASLQAAAVAYDAGWSGPGMQCGLDAETCCHDVLQASRGDSEGGGGLGPEAAVQGVPVEQ